MNWLYTSNFWCCQGWKKFWFIFSFDLDSVFRVNDSKDIIMYCAKAEKTSEHLLARFSNTDIHIMNKKSVERHIDEFLNCGSVK